MTASPALAPALDRNEEMVETVEAESEKAQRRALLARLARFQAPSTWRSLGQLATTGVPYAAILVAMYALYSVSVWLSLALAIPAAGLVVRFFIIQHDCGHASFFRSRRANAIVGGLCSLVTFTPYFQWRRQHAQHHAVWNNLDQRDSGADIYSTCLTLAEYQALSPFRRWAYRAARHPVVAQIILPPLVFLVIYRLPFDTPRTWRLERRSVHLTNVALAAGLAVPIIFFGFGPVLMIQLSIMALASIAGVWLFSVQHRFEAAEWMRAAEWSPVRASLHGSSYLRLPRVLQWFTGNIGFHHVHHLVPRIPNYRLQACHEALGAGYAATLTFREALRAPAYALWDEAAGRMTPFPRAARS